MLSLLVHVMLTRNLSSVFGIAFMVCTVLIVYVICDVLISVFAGKIAFQDVEQLLPPNSTDDQVTDQVKILFNMLERDGATTDEKIMQLRIRQIVDFLKIKKIQPVAKLVTEVKNKLGLIGDFGGFDKPLVCMC